MHFQVKDVMDLLDPKDPPDLEVPEETLALVAPPDPVDRPDPVVQPDLQAPPALLEQVTNFCL